MVRETDPQGRVVVRTFDARNNRLSETEPTIPASPPSPIPTTTYSYDAPGQPAQHHRRPRAHRATYTYNATPPGADDEGRADKTTTNVYDPKGNLLTTTDALGHDHELHLRRPRQRADADGHGRTARRRSRATSTTAYGRLNKETDAARPRDDLHLRHERQPPDADDDADGLRLHDGRSACLLGLGHRDAHHDLRVRPERPSRDDDRPRRQPSRGRSTTRSGGRSRATTSWNRKTALRVRRDGPSRRDDPSRPHAPTSTATTPRAAARPARTAAAGRRATNTTRLGRLKQDDLPGHHLHGEHLRRGGPARRPRRTPAARRRATSTTRAGRRTAVDDPLGNETVFTYDANGNQKTVTDAQGQRHHLRVRRPQPPDEDDLPVRRRQSPRRRRRRPATTSWAGGRARPTRPDKTTQLRVRQARPADRGRRRARPARRRYGYDELGNRTVPDGRQRPQRRSFQYDKLGRQTARILPDGKTRGDDLRRGRQPRDPHRLHGPDHDLRLRRQQPPHVSAPTRTRSENVSFTYTATGRRETATDARGTTTYGYDLRDRLTSLHPARLRRGGTSRPASATTYDGNGNRTSLTATVDRPSSHATSYTYDDAGRLDVVTDPVGRAYDHGYDPNGNRAASPTRTAPRPPTPTTT